MRQSEIYREHLTRLQALADANGIKTLWISQKDAAELMGCSRSTLWRNGIGRQTTLEQLAELASKKKTAEVLRPLQR